MTQPPLGLLLLSHGAAETMDGLPSYYAHILHGRTPQPARLEALKARYRAIGSASPLNRITRQQAVQMAEHLRLAGVEITPFVGFQHVAPFIGDAVRQMVDDGVREAVVMVMTPYYSPLGVGHYLAEVDRALRAGGTAVAVHAIRQWHDQPAFLGLLTQRVGAALQTLAQRTADSCHVIFTAHSLPVLRNRQDDPYVEQFTATARTVAERLGLPRWSTCYQSASQTGQPWLEPDILDEVDRVAQTGAQQVVVCPTSFAADNLEVLYDIGLEARRRAQELGMAFALTVPFNDDPAFTRFLAQVVAQRLPVAA